MLETFLILLCGGIMLASAISDPKQVTLPWLRLGGVIALVMGGLSLFFYFATRDTGVELSGTLRVVQIGLLIATLVAIIIQLTFVQVAQRTTQRLAAAAAFLLGVLAGSNLLHEMMIPLNTAIQFPPKMLSILLQTLACAGVAAAVGLALMDMLLGHAYLTASQMTMKPFLRLNLTLAAALGARAVLAVGVVLALQHSRPVEMLWSVHGLLIGTRWLIGLLLPGVFIYMAHDCIRRRATQSATGILYVAGILIFLGELIALHLVRQTGLPF